MKVYRITNSLKVETPLSLSYDELQDTIPSAVQSWLKGLRLQHCVKADQDFENNQTGWGAGKVDMEDVAASSDSIDSETLVIIGAKEQESNSHGGLAAFMLTAAVILAIVARRTTMSRPTA